MTSQKIYKKTSPCPVCDGYNGAYAKENKCKGFTTDTVVYCQQIESAEFFIFFGGLKLFKHSKEQLHERGSVLQSTNTALHRTAIKPLSPSPRTDYSRADRSLQTEVVSYEERGPYQPAIDKTFYVVYDGEKEIMRSLHKEVAERFMEA